MPKESAKTYIAEDLSRLLTVPFHDIVSTADTIVRALREDNVVLVKEITPDEADALMKSVSAQFDLEDALALQTSLAGMYGHRHNVGKYFMSVNKRSDYQVITPHCEGSSLAQMQIASFYCYENSTDGGESILLNVEDSSPVWQRLREIVTRVKTNSRPLTPKEISRLRAVHRVRMPDDVLKADDRVLNSRQSLIEGIELCEVLAKPRRTPSRVLNRDVYAYWDSIASIDHQSAKEFILLLQENSLLKIPAPGYSLDDLDNAHTRRVWNSQTSFSEIFRCKVTCTLGARDFIIMNNLTWSHSASNWTPESGIRRVAAAFA